MNGRRAEGKTDGVKEERLKVTEGEEGDIALEKYNRANACPPEQPFYKGPRTICTKTNEITDPRVG